MKKLLLFQIMICCCAGIPAQGTVRYHYDASGNRVSRTIVLPKQSVKAADERFSETLPQKEQLGEIGITVYPNPTRGLLKVAFENLPDDSSVQLQVLDMRGRSLLVQTSAGNAEIDLSDRPAGNYLLVIICGGKTTTWKIIKQ